ncbi:hypothetical protein [Flammeovirga pacifica]|uniref:Phage tail protein n=1 Tax=Flammeovirga pacifica TaxID=915059 RepID=A0A1S1Z291_FLAPC|nr:hypothetical protein [Flammeovirga pacifica]OHX67361.1 hypothetical protein NH26_13920 [Flammeovirga pacifica]
MNIGGVRHIAIADYRTVTTDVTGNVLKSISGNFQKLDAVDDSIDIKSQNVVAGAGEYYKYSISLRIAKVEEAKYSVVDHLKRVVLLWLDENGVSWIVGFDYPLLISVSPSFGKSASQLNHFNIKFVGNSVNRPLQSPLTFYQIIN